MENDTVEQSEEQRLSAVINNFKRFLLLKKGFSENTIAQHAGVAKRLLSVSPRPTPRDFEEYICQMYNNKAKYFHIVNSMRTMESLSEFVGTPVKFGRPKNKPKQIIHDALTEPEIVLIIAAAKNLRERAIITLLAYSGIRNRELCNLRKGDVDLALQFVHVREGKGCKDRLVCISGSCVQVLTDYIAAMPLPAQNDPESFLFTTVRNKTQLQSQDLRKIVRIITRKAGNKKNVHPHLFRHSLATNMIKRGASVIAVKEQLGHAFVQTTMIYVHSTQQRLAIEYRAFCPEYV